MAKMNELAQQNMLKNQQPLMDLSSLNQKLDLQKEDNNVNFNSKRKNHYKNEFNIAKKAVSVSSKEGEEAKE
jgi:hypothetical protein